MTSNLALNIADFASDKPKSGYLTTANTDIGNDVDGETGIPSRATSGDLITLSAPEGGNSGVLRWDPALSSLRKAVGIKCPSVSQADLDDMETSSALLSACPAASEITTPNSDYAGGNYFEIVSENYLGVKQHYQLQPSNVRGTVTENDQQVNYHWGSKCTAVGTENSSASATPANNDLTEMPRSYYAGVDAGSLYNWYGATAGSGTMTMVNDVASDSVCPNGWQLPNAFDDKSLMNMLSYYFPDAENKLITDITKYPIGIQLYGRYDFYTGDRKYPKGTFLQANQASGQLYMKIAYSYGNGFSMLAITNASDDKAHGESIRCVKKAPAGQ